MVIAGRTVVPCRGGDRRHVAGVELDGLVPSRSQQDGDRK